MASYQFEQLLKLYNDGNIHEICNANNGIYFLKLKAISKKKHMEEFCKYNNIPYKKNKFLKDIYDEQISEKNINKFINTKNQIEISKHKIYRDKLYDELYKIERLDWGGLWQNGLEKTIVDNYIKKIQNYDELNDKILKKLNASVMGYVHASWYNHWTSVLIEDKFNEHKSILPTLSKIKFIDFFWHDIPFDLKTTYLPKEFIDIQRKNQKLKTEISVMKDFVKINNITYNELIENRHLHNELYSAINNSTKRESIEFIIKLKQTRNDIIKSAQINPDILSKWLYENQGARRFDYSYRIYLILINMEDINGSWRLKRNKDILTEEINTFLNKNPNELIRKIKFNWKNNIHDTKYIMHFITIGN